MTNRRPSWLGCFPFFRKPWAPQDQLANRYSSPRDRYSVVSFNDVAKVQLRGKSMHGRNLYALRKVKYELFNSVTTTLVGGCEGVVVGTGRASTVSENLKWPPASLVAGTRLCSWHVVLLAAKS